MHPCVHQFVNFFAEHDRFIERIWKGVLETLKVSKVERPKLCFTGLDVQKIGGQIEILMEEYSRSLDKILDIWRQVEMNLL